MIEVGTRVHSRSFDCDGIVVSLGAEAFEVDWAGVVYGTPTQYPYAHLVDVHGNGPHIQIIPSEPVTGTAESSYRDAAIERLAYNSGTMEFELFMVWRTLNYTVEAMDADGNGWALTRLTDIIESIARTAEQLKPKRMTDGTVETAWLAAQIYANSK